MKKEQDYIQDIAEIRSMMERSSKFLSLSGGSGIMAGIYALSGTYIASEIFLFHPDEIAYSISRFYLWKVISLAVLILVLAVGTAILFSYKKANHNGEKIWNATSRRLLANLSVPLIAGGILIVIVITKGLLGLAAPLSLLFYGLALYNGSKFTFYEVKYLGLLQIVLGLISSNYIEYSLLIWALGFGFLHIGYGIYLHLKYER